MDIEKINDFLNCYFDVMGMTDESITQLIKNGIIKRYNGYIEVFPIISIDDDNYQNYAIKSKNGYYTLEDFLLNRLFQGLREISTAEDENIQSCRYSFKSRTIYFLENKIRNSILSNLEQWPQDIKEKFAEIILSTVFDHELGHALKTQFDGGYKVTHDNSKALFDEMFNILKESLGEEKADKIFSSICDAEGVKSSDDLYKELLEKLLTVNNGKYSEMIMKPSELIDDYSFVIGSGINKNNESDEKNLLLLDELLQETESMNIVQCYTIPQTKRNLGSNGNYINIYHIFSGYSPIIGYGRVLTSLLGRKGIFEATYLNPNSIFIEFNNLYSDISESVFQNDLSPITNINNSLNQILSTSSETLYLQLDLFFSMCYERMFNKRFSKNLDLDVILKEIKEIQDRLTNNVDETINSQLPHNKIFNNLKRNLSSFDNVKIAQRKPYK